jgi:hypothetical protein
VEIKILPFPLQYIQTLLLFVVKNKNHYKVNLEVHNICTRQHSDLHQPLPSLVKYQKGVYCGGIKVFNCLPSYMKDKSDNPREFKLILRLIIIIIIMDHNKEGDRKRAHN